MLSKPFIEFTLELGFLKDLDVDVEGFSNFKEGLKDLNKEAFVLATF
ncbi:hypothetical protein BMG_5703 (plasmid) [Priestia megaterium]|nr:hypothetical protein BMG_5703 [Priestia megaterium]